MERIRHRIVWLDQLLARDNVPFWLSHGNSGGAFGELFPEEEQWL